MDHIKPIQPGDRVFSSSFPDRGEATASYVNPIKGEAMLVWGDVSQMDKRQYAVVQTSTLSRPRRDRKRIPIKKK